MQKIIIQTPAPNISASKDFYNKAGFESIVDIESKSYRGDGNLIVNVNGNADARLGICLYTDQFNALCESLCTSYQGKEIDGGFIFSDPNGVRFYLYPWDLWPIHEHIESPTSGLGSFAGIGIESVDYLESIKFWKTIGYQSNGGDIERDKYQTLEIEGGFYLTIYTPGICPHAFYNPSLTYFNGKENNPKIIDHIRSLNLEIVEEITVFNDQGVVDNIIVRDPGGLHAFIFND